jgi:glutaminase
VNASSTPGEQVFVSTGTLPSRDEVRAVVETAYARFRGERSGRVADYIPALAEADPEAYGLCAAGTRGETFAAGDADVPFSIHSVS